MMKHWARLACALMGVFLTATTAIHAEEAQSVAESARPGIVVDIKSDRIILMDVARAGDRLIAVGERGFTLVSDDSGKTWKAQATPVTRTLTSVAFADDKVGVAVGHGGSAVRTEDGGASWTDVTIEEAVPDSLLGVASLGGGHFVAYGAFGLYFDSTDAGRSWERRTVISEDFDRHISQVLPVGPTLFMVAESGTLARSEDGGETWMAVESPYEGSYFAALTTKDGALLAFGMRGNIYRSMDGGGSWQKVEIGTTASIMAGKQLADGRILLVGNAGLLADSHDDGQTVELHWSPFGKGFAALVEVSDGVILVGESGVTRLDPAWLMSTQAPAAE
jgi:photosystem II stability/assembly factor-like uncharacterized protein